MDRPVVTVIVYHAKGLKPRKKGKHKFSVKFGIGKTKYVTDPVEDLFNNPAWNTESDIEVSDPAEPLKMVVSAKDEILGQVVVPLADLPKFQRHRKINLPLMAHKKCAYPDGELFYEAWFSSTASPDSVSLRSDGSQKKKSFSSGLKKIKDKLSHSPTLGRRNKGGKDGGVSYGLAQRGALSMHDLSVGSGMFTVAGGGSQNSLNSDPGESERSERKRKAMSVYDLKSGLGDDGDDTDESMKPEINGVSPRESPEQGGVKVTIRGENLGLRKDDVVGLYICGSNCLPSLQYISAHKLICVTSPWKAGTGNIVIETQSGGKGVSLVEFAFVPSRPTREEVTPQPSPTQLNKSKEDISDGNLPTDPAPAKPPRRIKASTDLLDGSPDLRRRSAPVGSLRDSPTLSVHSASPQPSPNLSEPIVLRKKPPKSPVKNPEKTPEVTPTATETPRPTSTFYTTIDEKPPAPADPNRPVAEIKPQQTGGSTSQRKRQAPAPPGGESRSENNSPAPNDAPNLDVINGTASSRFYDISFVSDVHSDKDEETVVEDEQTTFYFDREKRDSGKPRSAEREEQVMPMRKSVVVPSSPGPTKREFDELKEKERALEIEQKKSTEELRKWKEAFQKVQQENQVLRDESDSMKLYIEKLVSHVIIHCPEALNHDRLYHS